MESFLDLLRPATDESLSKFNSQEEKQGHFGVFSIDFVWVESEFDELLAGTDIDTLGANFNDIDTCLAGSQVEYEDYIADTAATGGKHIKTTLANPRRRIQKARKMSSSTFFHWVNCRRKLSVTFRSHQRCRTAFKQPAVSELS